MRLDDAEVTRPLRRRLTDPPGGRVLRSLPWPRSISTAISVSRSGSGGSATTRRCSTSSPAPTWRAVRTPAIRRRCDGCARRQPIEVSRSALRSDIQTSPGSGADSSTSTRSSCAMWCSTSSEHSTPSPRSPAPESPMSSRTARCTTPASPTRHRPKQSPTAAHEYDPSLAVLACAGLAVARGRRRARHGARRRGVRRPGVSRRWHAGAAERAGCGAQRSGRRSPPVLLPSPPSGRQAVDGTVVDLDARSICIHGDTPGAVALARAVRSALEHAVGRHLRLHGVTHAHPADGAPRRADRAARRRAGGLGGRRCDDCNCLA